MLDWSSILRDLVEGVEWRLRREIPTTEDTVRYYFYLRLIKSGIKPGSMILERPHPHRQMEHKQIDLSVVQPDGIWDFEIKYHRPIPSGHNRPRTQLRGQIVSDLYRLALSDGRQRHFVYVADPEMAAHWKRQEKQLVSARRSRPMILTLRWLSEQPPTLRRAVKKGIGFLPNHIQPSVWVEASYSGKEIESWLMGVR